MASVIDWRYDISILRDEDQRARRLVPYFEFIWTDEIVDHLAEHGVSIEDIEDFEFAVSYPSRVDISRSSGRPCCWGESVDGRQLFCVYEQLDDSTIIPVTGYELPE